MYSMFTLDSPSCENDEKLVIVLKRMLNELGQYRGSPLPLNSVLDTETMRRAHHFSTSNGIEDDFGEVGSSTLVELAKYSKSLVLSGVADFPKWLKHSIQNPIPNLKTIINQVNIWEFLESNFNKKGKYPLLPTDGSYKKGFAELVTFMADDNRLNKNYLWASYMLATVMVESVSSTNGWKRLFVPVKERNGGKKWYGKPQIVMNRKGVPLGSNGKELGEITGKVSDPAFIPITRNLYRDSKHNRVKRKYYLKNLIVMRRYYGRGYVQITTQDNYQAMDDALRLNTRLHVKPDLEYTDKDISYEIISYGMVNGSFRGNKIFRAGYGYTGGHKLADFITNKKTDYIGARKIVNGKLNKNDPTNKIAKYAKVFQTMYEAL